MSDETVLLKKWTSVRAWDNRRNYDTEGRFKKDETQIPLLVGRIVDIRPGKEYVIVTLDTGFNLSFKREDIDLE